MIGTIVQYLLYGLLALTVALAAAGSYLTMHVRKGADIDMVPVLSALALIASAAPYVGLFGTVWHIIQALGGIGGGNLNVAAIAKPIGQALFATLWGLGCAIPALIFHRVLQMLLPAEEDGGELAGEVAAEPAVEA